METNRLRQFCVICETGNLRRAAEILGLSHSALSKSLKVLQEEIQVPLLLQSGRGIAITDEGKRLHQKFLAFLKSEEELFKSVQPSEAFRIGTFEVFSSHFLPAVWDQYFRGKELELREFLPGLLEKALLDSVVDFGLTYEPVPTAGIDFLKVARVKMGIFARKDLRASEFAELPFVAPVIPANTPSGVKGLDGWPDDKLPRKISFKVDMMESGLSFARLGKAAIFIPHFVARFHNRTVQPEFALKLHPEPKGLKPVFRDVYLVKRSSTSESAAAKTLAKMIRIECVD